MDSQPTTTRVWEASISVGFQGRGHGVVRSGSEAPFMCSKMQLSISWTSPRPLTGVSPASLRRHQRSYTSLSSSFWLVALEVMVLWSEFLDFSWFLLFLFLFLSVGVVGVLIVRVWLFSLGFWFRVLLLFFRIGVMVWVSWIFVIFRVFLGVGVMRCWSIRIWFLGHWCRESCFGFLASLIDVFVLGFYHWFYMLMMFLRAGGCCGLGFLNFLGFYFCYWVLELSGPDYVNLFIWVLLTLLILF